MSIEDKAIRFLTALMDVYRDEEVRELDAFPKLELSGDVTEDFTAMLLAMHVLSEQFTNSGGERDLIDFTHILNKLAVQHIFARQED